VNEWFREDLEIDGKQEARVRVEQEIIEFLINPSKNTLDFSGLELFSLPKCLAFDEISRKICGLNLSDNCFEELPDFICEYSRLQSLDLSKNNFLLSLPENIGELDQLSTLCLFQDLQGSDPLLDPIVIPASFANLHSLSTLGISGYAFTQIPGEIFQLPMLSNLTFSHCALESVPYLSLDQLRFLSVLDLSSNHIEDLSGDVEVLSYLNGINLSNNPIGFIPENFYHLEEQTSINIEEIEWETPEAFDEFIQEISALDYEGPDFTYSLNPFPNVIHQILSNIYGVAKEDQVEGLEEFLEAFEDAETLQTWFDRLKWAEPEGEVKKESFYKFVLEILKKAFSDESFKQVFYSVLTESISSCGDRVLLNLLTLDMEQQKRELDRKNPAVVAEFLRTGPYALVILEEYARTFIAAEEVNLAETLRAEGRSDDEIKIIVEESIDPIEVLLGLPIKLKEALFLPINLSHMHFFNISNLSQHHLDEAMAEVSARRSNLELFLNYLVESDFWLEVLRENFKERYESILEELAELDQDETIEEARREKLKELSRVALDKDGLA
jgi:Trp operon repressor